MKVVVIGATQIGVEIARMLSNENHEVTVLDESDDRLQNVRDQLEVFTHQGYGTSVSDLRIAGVNRADYVIAVTEDEQNNIIACMLTKRMNEQVRTIACLFSAEMFEQAPFAEWDIDYVVHPEESTANQILRLMRRAGATDITPFVDGQVMLIGLRLTSKELINQTVRQMVMSNAHATFRLVVIQRNTQTLIPQADTILKRNDHLFFLAKSEDVPAVIKLTGNTEQQVQDIMILGNSDVSRNVARVLNNLYVGGGRDRRKHIKMIEPDRNRAEKISNELEHVLIIHAPLYNIDMLTSEGLDSVDVLVAVTDDAELNLMTSLLAAHYGVKKTIAGVSQSSYIPLTNAVELDSMVNANYATSRDIMNFIRSQGQNSIAAVPDVDAEILELVAGERASITKGPLRSLILPRGMVIGYVQNGDKAEVATANTQIHEGDQVVLFVLPHLVEEARYYFEGIR
ncbi:MAG TPA: Trk system potassium transporter TrkA [Rhodothermales bacterium]|nr:Trk system potassium transporter TrkA [Rhodothermales bacterium]HRR07369.1 Trk system potassium transporter TrkA [Rhodothermales bacterium]